MKELRIHIEIQEKDGETLHQIICMSIDSAIEELKRFEAKQI